MSLNPGLQSEVQGILCCIVRLRPQSQIKLKGHKKKSKPGMGACLSFVCLIVLERWKQGGQEFKVIIYIVNSGLSWAT